jgi:enoyl-CoA hydratase
VIEVTRQGRVTVLTLDRPQKRNALNTELCERLAAAATGAVADEARAVVLTGSGTSFCSGADLGEVYTSDFRDALYAMLTTITDLPVPVVAAVNGPAIGGGTQLAIAADLRVVGPGAVFGVPAARLGLAVDPWTIRRFSLLAGNATARAVFLAADQLDADGALRCGLADRAGSLDEAVARAEAMAELAPLTVAYSKRVLNTVGELGDSDPSILDAFDACWASDDFAEGRAARAEKRPPAFRGR